MLTRRTFLAAGSLVAGTAFAAAHLPQAFSASRSRTLYIQDLRLRDAGLALPKAPLGAALVTIEGDVTRVWLEVVLPHITHSRAPITGLTQEDALFCLRTLAQDYGWQMRRCHGLQPSAQPAVQGHGCSETPLAWILSPEKDV